MRTRIAIAFVIVLALAGCRATHGHIDPELAPFIPAHSLALAGVHVGRLRATPLYRRLAEAHRLPEFDDLRAGTGLDPGRDFREVLVANDGRNTLVMALGDLHPKVPPSVGHSDYNGYTLYANGENVAFAFIGGTVALAGPPAAVRAAIDLYKSGGRRATRALTELAANVPAEAQIWAIAHRWAGFPPEALQQMGNAANLNRLLQSVADAWLSIDMRSGVHVTAVADSPTDQDAKTLLQSLTGLAALGRLALPKNQPDLMRAYETIQIRQETRSVRVSADIPEDLAERLARNRN